MTTGDRVEREALKLGDAISSFASFLATVDGPSLGEGLIHVRESTDRLEATFADGLRRFDKSGEYAADGALSIVAWLRWKCRLSAGAAAERVSIARQLDKLPGTEAAFACGDLGYQHVAAIARTADNVGATAVRQEEAQLLKAAQTMDPGQFSGVVKSFEHRVDAAFALAEANRAYARRYLHLSEPNNGLMHLEGLLDTEGGATLKTALEALMPPPNKDDDRSAGQRRADALVDLARKALDGSRLGTVGGQRPHLVITASPETLAGVPGAPPAQLQGVGPIPMETAQRYACDATVSYLYGQVELAGETSHEHRRISASTRRALVARDRDCVFPGCHRPPTWCNGHHLIWWTRGGKTELPNLALVCGRHHRMFHEKGWTLARESNERWVATPPEHRTEPHARSA